MPNFLTPSYLTLFIKKLFLTSILAIILILIFLKNLIKILDQLLYLVLGETVFLIYFLYIRIGYEFSSKFEYILFKPDSIFEQ